MVVSGCVYVYGFQVDTAVAQRLIANDILHCYGMNKNHVAAIMERWEWEGKLKDMRGLGLENVYHATRVSMDDPRWQHALLWPRGTHGL